MRYVNYIFLNAIFLFSFISNIAGTENVTAPAAAQEPPAEQKKANSNAVNYIDNGSFEFGIDKGWKAFEERANDVPLILGSENIVVADETVSGGKYLKFMIPANDKEKKFFLTSKPFTLKEKAGYIVKFAARTINSEAKCKVKFEKFRNEFFPENDRKANPVFETIYDKIPGDWSLLAMPVPDINPDTYVLSMEIELKHSAEKKQDVRAALCIDAVQLLSEQSDEAYVSAPCEFDVGAAFGSNIMLRNEQGFLRVAAYNYTDENIYREVFLTVYDFYGKEISTEKYKFDRVNGMSEKTIALPSLPFGPYMARLRDAEGKILAEKCFAVLPVPSLSPDAGTFSVADKTSLENFKKSGVKFLALKDMPDYLDYKRNQLENWQMKNLDQALKNGIEVIGILYMPIQRGKKLNDEELDAFSNYAKAMFELYKGKIKYWRLMDNPYMDNCSPADYAKLLKAVNQSVKSGFPDVRILGPACSSTYSNWIEEFIQTGTLNMIDIFTVKGYGADDRAFEQLKKWAWADGKKRPIWDTGFGVIQSQSQYAQGNDLPEFPHRIKTCSAIVKALTWKYRTGIDKFFYNSYDRGTGWNANQMFEPDGTLKPEAVVYSTVSNMMNGSLFVKDISIGKMQCYVFKNKTKTFAVIWNTEAMDDDETKLLLQPQEMIYSYILKQKTALKNKPSVIEPAVLSLPLKQNKGLDIKDIFGNNMKIEEGAEGTINIRLKYEPVFIFSEMNPQIFSQAMERARISLPDGAKITCFACLKPFMDKTLLALSIKLSNMTSQTLYPEITLRELPDGMILMGNESVNLTLNAFEEKDIEFFLNPEKDIFEKVSAKYEIKEGKNITKKDFKFSLVKAIRVDGSFAMKCDTAVWPPFESPMKIDHIGQLVKGSDYWNGPEDLSLKASVFYNDEFLYILMKGVSSSTSKGGTVRNSFDLFFDTDLKDIRYNSRNLDDYLITFFPSLENSSPAMFRTSSYKDENMIASINFSGNDFAGEFRFSRKALNIENKNSLIRFDMNLNKFSPDDVEPQIIMPWSASSDNSISTEGYGYLMVGP